jgi:hypothetical protein
MRHTVASLARNTAVARSDLTKPLPFTIQWAYRQQPTIQENNTMEPTQRTHIIDGLVEEVVQKISVLEHALAAQKTAQEELRHGHGTTSSQEHTNEAHVLEAERALWEQAKQGLSEVRTVLEQIEESERRRGVIE